MSLSSFSTDQATFIGFAVEAIAYGTYVILFSISFIVFLSKSKSGQATPPMFFISCYLFSLCTVHFALNFHNVYNGLLVHVRPISQETGLLEAADAIVFVTDFSAQLVLIYRCWLVWEHNHLIVVFPTLMATAAFACSFGALGLLNKIDPNLLKAPAAIIPLGTSGFALSLCLNFIVTTLIAGRIWYISREARKFVRVQNGGLMRAMGLIIESGLLFLVVQFVFVVLFAIGHPAQDVLVPLATQVYGIAPTLIIVRVGMGSSFERSSFRESPLQTISFVKRRPSLTSQSTSDPEMTLEFPSRGGDGGKIGSSETTSFPSTSV